MQDDTWSFAAHVSRVYGYGLPFWKASDTLTLELYFTDNRPRLILEFFLSELSGGSRHSAKVLPRIYLDLKLIATDPTSMPWKTIRTRPLVNGDPLSQKVIQWVRSKLDICFESHVICPLATERPFPKRILALERNSIGEICVKVMEMENTGTLGIYATLSHCWGLELPCVMSRGNRTDRMRGIPWTELPKTFQDAVRYSLELDISYLWIDALCIVQDDPEDWQIQSARMASIYENSYITLAATSSDCGSSGCFQERSMAHRERSLEVRDADGQVFQILIRQTVPHWTVPPTTSSKQENPLLSRGWVFQERILSPRVLHFCKEELVWECGQETVCECGGIPKTRNLKQQFSLAARHPGLEDSPQIEQHLEGSDGFQNSPSQSTDLYSAQEIGVSGESVNQWHGIVEQYSSLDLTHDKDILPALSGLAERMAPFLGDYLAGLWRRSLLFDLCWRVDKLVYGPQVPMEYRGPSWSWVSTKATVAFWTREGTTPSSTVAGPIRTHSLYQLASSSSRSNSFSGQGSLQPVRYEREYAPNIVSCTVDTYGKNKYGEISSAVLIMDGYLKETRIWRESAFPNSAVPPSFQVGVERGAETGHSGWSLPFFADYILSFDSGVHFLLAISTNICLVLSKTSLRLSRDTFIFRRVGILQIPYLTYRYGVDLMRGSQMTRVAII